MITEKIGDLLDSDCSMIIHQANLYHTFGAGIARAIRERFPAAYTADCLTINGDAKKLGSFSVGIIKDKTSTIKRIVNLYSQVGIGGQDRNTSYDAMVRGLTTLRDLLEDAAKKGRVYKLGIPYKLGCGLANGDYRIVRAIIESVFGDSKIQVEIYRRPED